LFVFAFIKSIAKPLPRAKTEQSKEILAHYGIKNMPQQDIVAYLINILAQITS
jgi:hypothetical protein